MSGVERQDAPTFDRTDSVVVEPMLAYNGGGARHLIMDDTESNIHAGITYSVCHYEASLANNGTIDIVLTVGSTLTPHVIAQAALGGDALGQIYEDVIITTPGTALVPNNINREVADASSITVDLDGTLNIASATLLEETFIPGGSVGTAVGNSAESRAERILARTKLYLYRLTNLAGTAQGASLDLEWSEEALIT